MTTSSTRSRSNSNLSTYSSPITTSIVNHFDNAMTTKADLRGHVHGTLSTAEIEISESSETQREPLLHGATVPQWQRELAASRVGRHSRASSVMSTRTRLTVQSDDARSIEFEAGGQSFRISRDGARVTNLTAPPPYPGPPLEDLTEESDDEEAPNFPRTSNDTVRNVSLDTDTQDGVLRTIPIRTHHPPEQETSPATNRKQGMLELPQRLKSVLRWYGSSIALEAEGIQPSRSTDELQRTEQVAQLRRTQSDSSSLAYLRAPQLYSNEEKSLSKGTGGLRNASPVLDAERQMHEAKWLDAATVLDADDEQTAEVSRHYTRMMRDMDREHRKRLHERDNEMARLRELLNEKDMVYRQQLRERDHVIEGLTQQACNRDRMINDLKTRIYYTEEGTESKVEKARNEVEDQWEKRWKEYEVVLIERMGNQDEFDSSTPSNHGRDYVQEEALQNSLSNQRRA